MPDNPTDPAENPSQPESSGLAGRGSPGETDIQSFIVKLWLGEVKGAPGRPTWRGYITHVPSGRRRYLKKLGDVTDFIAPYINPRPAQSSGGPGLKAPGTSRRENPSFFSFRLASESSTFAGVLKSLGNPHGIWHRLKQNKKLRRVHKAARRREEES